MSISPCHGKNTHKSSIREWRKRRGKSTEQLTHYALRHPSSGILLDVFILAILARCLDCLHLQVHSSAGSAKLVYSRIYSLKSDKPPGNWPKTALRKKKKSSSFLPLISSYSSHQSTQRPVRCLTHDRACHCLGGKKKTSGITTHTTWDMNNRYETKGLGHMPPQLPARNIMHSDPSYCQPSSYHTISAPWHQPRRRTKGRRAMMPAT
ncbi:hypothetical protein CCHR01_09708 [Colletotrichum chrysophilum]|uniref:Uncharacterized protein n=1 Tax=Colletotrichum chrysophilum TaxID=1836956 RepID=A0AAD9EK38_9PEZI|nr:hypothetical protein CCHR01_09708 [Colletotrichum chrysophilum]